MILVRILFTIYISIFFFFNDTATTEIYTLSLHDALPISPSMAQPLCTPPITAASWCWADRKSTRLNSSHTVISYAVFCLKKKKNKDVMKAIDRVPLCGVTGCSLVHVVSMVKTS